MSVLYQLHRQETSFISQGHKSVTFHGPLYFPYSILLRLLSFLCKVLVQKKYTNDTVQGSRENKMEVVQLQYC